MYVTDSLGLFCYIQDKGAYLINGLLAYLY